MKRASLWAGGIVVALGLMPAAAGAATITPTIATDEINADGDCSLREAVQAANLNAVVSGCAAGEAAPATDTIVLTSPAGVPYTLTVGSNDEEDNLEGDLDTDGAGGPVVVTSAVGSSVTTLAPDRIFDATGSSQLTLRGISVSDGDVTSVIADTDARGGNVRARSSSTLVLEDVTVEQGEAREGGGGVLASGTFSMTGSRIADNMDASAGGGVFILGGTSAAISDSVITGNQLTGTNLGNMRGGGIRASVDDGAAMTIEDSTISANSVHHLGLQPSDQAFGGGISIASQGVIRRTLIEGNTTESNATAVEHGGGLQIDGGAVGETVTVVNSTIYDNNALGGGHGGGVYLDGNVSVALTHTTFSQNSAAGVAGGDSIENGGASTATLRASIVPNGLLGNACEGPGAIASAGFNVTTLSDGDCNFTAADSAAGLTVGIGAIADNGGPTRTIPLAAGSPAIDFVPASECGPSEGQDQRGFFRPSGTGCDAGAYERVTCNGVVQEGPAAVDCPPLPPPTPPAQVAPCTGLKKKARKRCLCKQKKSKKKRKKCLRKLKARKRG